MTKVGLKRKCEREFCPNWVSRKTKDAIWDKAWEDGHAYGPNEVEMHYQDLIEIIRTLEVN